MSVLPFDQRDGFIWMNGNLVAWKDAKLHVLSHGLHYASCVFEGERAYGGRIFKSTRTFGTVLEPRRNCSISKFPIRQPNWTGQSNSSSTKTICKIAMSARSPGAAAK